MLTAAVVGFGARHMVTQRARKAAAPRAQTTAQTHKSAPAPAPAPEPRTVPPLTADEASALHWLAIGGGATPESTEISLEQNMQLARETLPGPGRVLFAGGAGSRSVRTLDEDAPADELIVQLGDLFQPRSGRTSHYVATSLDAPPASLPRVESELETAFTHGDAPLIVYIAAHGDQGDHARDNAVALWGGRNLSVARLAELHDAHPRPLRLISASCFSGGFAELAFTDADEQRGATHAPRCGVFAGTWDRETSGCDPDPDRRKQEGYSLHLLQALRGRDRDGQPLPLHTLDLDGDGRISLLEAHTHASIAAQSIDVPTTTAQRYLRAVQSKRAPIDMKLVPEEAAVVQRLGAELGLASEHAVEERWDAVDRHMRELDTQLDAADARVSERYAELSGRLLARWPVLDDAYHPDFAATLAHDHAEIARALSSWPEAQAHASAQQEAEELEGRYERVEVEDALLTRLLRAYETLALAAALHARGGPQWARYQAFLACERFVPNP